MSIEEALHAWLKKVLDMPQLCQQDLSDPKIFYKLIEQIPGFTKVDDVESENPSDWQNRYISLKNMYQGIESYYRDQLNSTFPSGLPSINLLLMSKGQQKQSFMILLQILFIACIQCSSREKFITHIMNLEEGAMKQLMNLIQQSSLKKDKQYAEQQQQNIQQQEGTKIDQLYFKIQSLYSENETLRNQFFIDNQQRNKLAATIQKLEGQKKKLRRQLDEKIMYMQQKEQQQQQEQSTNKVMSESNQQIITILKKQLLEQQHKYLIQKSKLKQENLQIQQQLNVARQKISELQSQSFASISSKVKHQNCISTNQHKSITTKLQLKLKSSQQKLTELQRELVRAKYEVEEKERRIRKQEKEKKSMEEEMEEQKNKGPMIKSKDSKQLQMRILIGIRDSLRNKLNQPRNIT